MKRHESYVKWKITEKKISRIKFLTKMKSEPWDCATEKLQEKILLEKIMDLNQGEIKDFY